MGSRVDSQQPEQQQQQQEQQHSAENHFQSTMPDVAATADLRLQNQRREQDQTLGAVTVALRVRARGSEECVCKPWWVSLLVVCVRRKKKKKKKQLPGFMFRIMRHWDVTHDVGFPTPLVCVSAKSLDPSNSFAKAQPILHELWVGSCSPKTLLGVRLHATRWGVRLRLLSRSGESIGNGHRSNYSSSNSNRKVSIIAFRNGSGRQSSRHGMQQMEAAAAEAAAAPAQLAAEVEEAKSDMVLGRTPVAGGVEVRSGFVKLISAPDHQHYCATTAATTTTTTNASASPATPAATAFRFNWLCWGDDILNARALQPDLWENEKWHHRNVIHCLVVCVCSVASSCACVLKHAIWNCSAWQMAWTLRACVLCASVRRCQTLRPCLATCLHTFF